MHEILLENTLQEEPNKKINCNEKWYSVGKKLELI